MALRKIKARQIFDCRGEPTLEVDVITDVGLLRSSVPSHASTNPNQAREMRDENPAAYHGRSVFKAVDIVNNVIAPQLIKSGLEVCQQAEIDALLKKLDGTENKSRLGVNAILGVSVACCKAGAVRKGLPIYKYIAELAENNQLYIPVPSFNMIGGGRRSNNNLLCQEFAILPIGARGHQIYLFVKDCAECSVTFHAYSHSTGAESFADAVKMATEMYRVLERKIGDTLRIRSPLPVNDGGAFVPDLEDDKAALTLLNTAIRDTGYEGKIKIALDMAASAFYKEGGYDLTFKTKDLDPINYLKAEALRDRYLEYLSEFPTIVSIEDPFDREDWEGWLTIANQGIQVVSDDLTAMNIERIEEAMDRNVANCLLLRISQIGTVTEIINCAKMAKINDWSYIVSASHGDTEDNFISDLAVGLSANQFKAGAPCRSERMAKYNQILRIEEELGKDGKYVGPKYRNSLAK